MTNEEVFIIFLKEHRKFSSFKRQFRFNLEEAPTTDWSVQEAIHGITWGTSTEGVDYWVILDVKWRKVCQQFNLTGSVNYRTIINHK